GQRNGFYFDAGIARQASGLDGRTRGRILRKVSPVNLVHRREVVHVGQKNRRLNDAVKAASGCLKYSRQITHHLLGLFGHAARDELARFRIKRNLPRSKDETISAHSLRIRPYGRRRAFSFDNLPHYIDSLFFYSSNKLRILTEGIKGRQK